MAKAARPRIIPATMDSHGKPGIGGNAKGVETELMATVVSGVRVVGVVATVIVIGPVLAVVVAEMLAVLEVTGDVEAEELTAKVLEVLAAVVLAGLVVLVLAEVVVVMKLVITVVEVELPP